MKTYDPEWVAPTIDFENFDFTQLFDVLKNSKTKVFDTLAWTHFNIALFGTIVFNSYFFALEWVEWFVDESDPRMNEVKIRIMI